jgi:nitrogen-specific signal transduction histidine kinase/ActR/RegA family two-component response regulator
MATLTDVTARIEAERQLKLLQQFEVIGRLTGGVAHDFNNILSSVMGFARLARERLVSDSVERIHHYLSSIENSGKRGRKLVRQLLTYSQGDAVSNAREVALSIVVRETREMLRQVLPATMNLDLHIDPSIPPVRVDPLHIEQVLTNLVINARDAGDGRAHVAIELSQVEIQQETCSVCMQPVDGQWICLEVRDQGPGMDAAIIDRIFEPFFTTKKSGEGSGMGLSVVSGIVRSYGGHMLVDSAPGKGSSFRLLLPASDTPPSDHFDASPEEPAPHRETRESVGESRSRPRILVVDDEAPIRELLTEFMTDSGYVVLEAADGLRASLILADPELAIDAVITDQTMPGMTGLELAELIKARTPNLPVILCTGYSQAADPDALDSLPVDAVLIKPVDPDEIDTLLCSLLEKAAAASHMDHDGV